MIDYIVANKDLLAQAVLALIALATVIARITPTEKDDGFLAKLDVVVNKIFDFLKIPNNKK